MGHRPIQTEARRGIIAGMNALYRDPALYEQLHAEGTDDEVWLLDCLARRHGNGGKTALEPACGSGRYLAGLLRRGWRVSGYDLSPNMVKYARARLARWGEKARVVRGEMTSFQPKRCYDLAFKMTIPATARRRRERIINFIHGRGKLLESAYDLRSYDAAQLEGLLARSPLRVEACYGYDGRPAVLGGAQRALWLVLKLRQARGGPARRLSKARTRREKAR